MHCLHLILCHNLIPRHKVDALEYSHTSSFETLELDGFLIVTIGIFLYVDNVVGKLHTKPFLS